MRVRQTPPRNANGTRTKPTSAGTCSARPTSDQPAASAATLAEKHRQSPRRRRAPARATGVGRVDALRQWRASSTPTPIAAAPATARSSTMIDVATSGCSPSERIGTGHCSHASPANVAGPASSTHVACPTVAARYAVTTTSRSGRPVSRPVGNASARCPRTAAHSHPPSMPMVNTTGPRLRTAASPTAMRSRPRA